MYIGKKENGEIFPFITESENLIFWIYLFNKNIILKKK